MQYRCTLEAELSYFLRDTLMAGAQDCYRRVSTEFRPFPDQMRWSAFSGREIGANFRRPSERRAFRIASRPQGPDALMLGTLTTFLPDRQAFQYRPAFLASSSSGGRRTWFADRRIETGRGVIVACALEHPPVTLSHTMRESI